VEVDVKPKAEIPWKWFLGMAPAIGWDMAFQARALKPEDLPEKIVMRRPSKLEVGRLGEGEEVKLHCLKYTPSCFGAFGAMEEFVIDRKLFVWIGEAGREGAIDFDEEWMNPRSSSNLLIANANDAMKEQDRAKTKATVEQLLRNPRNLSLVKK
jgi:hypothetical protein